MTPQERWQQLAIHLFQQGTLSLGKTREMAHRTARAFQQLLGARDIAVHDDVEDDEQDLVTLRELGRI